ncbi:MULTISPECIES: hypothetical protein [unclassified Thermoactinomyces]|jgi:hypothetical protein|uniref:hypothetical protein n=1 Tax=unclassified Thermoactinomyces TaxID=2634588 RepID=UPI0018DCA21E|nr:MULTISPECIES: hypothetical protein [unclassified Thermoactinomyces]MBH8599275.1 hypothetical protein [Thermoactinomyces sp. CICC 10523]MBH8608826.1 hypothetical protein [Thermoactinomyces sp. CICC 10521]
MIDWTNWDMWAAIGQLLGTLATLLTAIIALIQVRDSRKHNEEVRRQAERQIQEAREAMKPELELHTEFQGFQTVRVLLVNKKTVPVYIVDFSMKGQVFNKDGNSFPTEIFKEEVSVEVPKYMNFGDVCIATIPIEKLKNKVVRATRQYYCTEGVFYPSFKLATGEKYTGTIYIDLKPDTESEEWAVYIHDEEKHTNAKDQLAKGRSIHRKF